MAMTPAEPTADVDRRRQVLQAARAAIAEHGLKNLRMTHIAELAHMSPGHILYYFKSKDRVLVETLCWSELELGEQYRAVLRAIEDAPQRLAHFIDLYLPAGPRDPGWALWIEIHGLALANPEIVGDVLPLVNVWQDEVAEIVALGIRQGHFRTLDVDEFSDWFKVLLDGYSLRIVLGDPRCDRATAIRRVTAVAADELGIPAHRLRTATAP